MCGQNSSEEKATAVWRWSNYLHDCVPVGKKALHLNLDETSVKLFTESSRGCTTASGRNKKYRGEGLRRKVLKGHTRASYSHIGLMCDQLEVQKFLPQIIVTNEHICSQACHDAVVAKVPVGFQIWRQKSSWVRIADMVRVLDEIGTSLEPFRDEFQPILCVDAAKVHLNAKVWQAARKWKILMLCIPAKVTYCLQPLDVYVFSNIKGSMRQSFQERNIMTQSGQVSFDSSITVYCRAVEKVLHSRSWAHAFERLGLTGTQENVSARLQRYMAVDSIYTVSKDFPTLGELQSCFPLRFDIPIDDVFGTVSHLAEEKKALEADPPDPSMESSDRLPLWVGRSVRSSASILAAADPPPLPPPAHVDSNDTWPAAVPVLRLRRLPSTLPAAPL